MQRDEIRRTLERANGADVRNAVRNGEWTWPTRGLARGYVQTAVVGLPSDTASDFLLFCQRNPAPCPLVEVVEPGGSMRSARGGDPCTDLPSYNLYRNGELVEQGYEIGAKFGRDVTWFVIGCSYSFEFILDEAGVELKGMSEGRGNPIFITARQCVPAGVFSGPLVVSMRPVAEGQVGLASCLSAKLPIAHGMPIHVGNPGALGIADVARPDFGSPSPIADGELPMFWACSVTAQVVAQASRVPLAITHKAGHMLVTDLKVLSMMA